RRPRDRPAPDPAAPRELVGPLTRCEAPGEGGGMRVLVWVADGVWEAAVDAAAAIAPPDAEFRLIHVVAEDLAEVTRGAFAGLLGRRYSVGADVDRELTRSSQEVLASARVRLGRPAELVSRSGRVEREVVAAADDPDDPADLLV